MKNSLSSLLAKEKAIYQLKNYAKYIALALLMGCTQCEKDPETEPDREAPKIALKQTSIGLETGDQLVPNSLVISISDNTDTNPTITASLNGQTISYTDAYAFSTAGDFTLKIKASDKFGNTNSSDIAINVGVGKPSLIGLEALQTTINPKTNIPMDLLSGVKATDTRDGDLTAKIKIFFKDQSGQYTEVTTPKTFITNIIGTLALKYQVTDNNTNTTISETSLNVASGLPVISGLENLQTVLNPKIDTPINFLQGVKATDAKEQDITANIKVFLKNQSGQYILVTNPTTYTTSTAGTLELKYVITDSYNQTTEVQKTLNITQETINIPQMQLKPNDPTFDPNNPEWNQYMCKNRAEYLTPIKVLEVRAMGESMVRSGTNDMSKSEYLAKLNNWQLALNNGLGKPIGTDATGQYITPNTIFPERLHEDWCNQILVGKENNGVGGVGVVGPLIQQGGVNKAIRLEDGWMENGYTATKQIEKRLQNNPGKYLVISTSSSLGDFKEPLKNILNTGRVIWFQSGGNVSDRGGVVYISATDQSATGDPREFKNGIGSYDLGNVAIPIQRVGGCRENFTVNVADPTRSPMGGSAYLTGDKKDIRYAPGVHAFYGQNTITAAKEASTSIAAPVQTGLYYLLVAAYPELTPVEILDKMRNEYAYPVKVTFAQEPTRGYTSKTTDIGKAYKDLNSKVPSTISLSSTSPVQIQKGRYKFNIIHGDGVTLMNGNKITNTDVNDVTKRGQLTQENYVIDPATLKKMGKKAGDEITIHVSVCGDDQEQYKQIRDIEYKVMLTN